jgi:hypothetical protein
MSGTASRIRPRRSHGHSFRKLCGSGGGGGGKGVIKWQHQTPTQTPIPTHPPPQQPKSTRSPVPQPNPKQAIPQGAVERRAAPVFEGVGARHGRRGGVGDLEEVPRPHARGQEGLVAVFWAFWGVSGWGGKGDDGRSQSVSQQTNHSTNQSTSAAVSADDNRPTTHASRQVVSVISVPLCLRTAMAKPLGPRSR